jgi:aspartyl/asparaginyl-tRNA synthetase
MKTWLAICLIVTSTLVWADEKTAPHQNVSVKGEVLEVINVANFTYLRLKTKEGETWAAVVQAQVQQGASVTIENAMIMNNFESKSLKRTFPTILFGTLGGAEASMPASASDNHVMGMASPLMPKKMDSTGDVHVPKASGANAHTVAEIMTKGAELKDKSVVVRGKVVKYNEGIMGMNWIHLRDGSGSVENETNDVLVTTTSPAKVGDVVTVKGIVHTNKDFGAGYSYKVLIEDATLQ